MMPLRSEFLFTIAGTDSSPVEVGSTPSGLRWIFPITGGTFEGPRLRGTILSGGADETLVRSDAVTVHDVRLLLETEDGQLIVMRYGGLRHGPPNVMERLARGEPVDPSEYYFRIAPLFETGSEKYAWLNRILAVGTGHRLPAGPIYDVYELL